MHTGHPLGTPQFIFALENKPGVLWLRENAVGREKRPQEKGSPPCQSVPSKGSVDHFGLAVNSIRIRVISVCLNVTRLFRNCTPTTFKLLNQVKLK
jgi:hypothetical protein